MLTTTADWARWWGAGSRIVAEPGGEVSIRHANGVEVSGQVVEIRPGTFLSFTYGYASGPIPPGGSLVEIALAPRGTATRLHLRHHFSEQAARDEHVQGWRFQLSLFVNVVLDRVHAEAATRVDAWFEAWAEPDETDRRRRFETLVSDAVVFRDRFSALAGREDLLAHVTAAQQFMPGVRMTRQGPVRQCQGTALVEWTAEAGGQPRGAGTTVFVFAGDGRMTQVVGFWASA
jgi:hypothetical protein